MIAACILALMTGAALGVILMGMLAAGRREDECRDCKRAGLGEPDRRLSGLITAAGKGSCDMSDGCPPDHGSIYPDATFCEGCTLGPLLADLRREEERHDSR